MTLQEKLMEDYKTALKARDEVKKTTISFARAAIKQVEIDNREELDDDGIIAVLNKQVKMRRDALADFEKAGRKDLAEAYKKEIEVLKAYLPKQLEPDEIMEIVRNTAEDVGVAAKAGKQNMGKLMGAVMAKIKGVADGNQVRKIIEEFLQD